MGRDISERKAANLTRRLLIFSRKQIAKVKTVDLNGLIQDLQNMLGRVISENIEFRLDLDANALAVDVDAGLIEQVLLNLAANAGDAMPEGGRLLISTGIEQLDRKNGATCGHCGPGSYALLKFADTGHGISPNISKKIFDPFYTTKGVGKGTGLGLAISYGIIQDHNGYMVVESDPGQGTVFKIYLPLSEKIP